ncbi:30S ribosomal protein S16 [Geobacter hydrogenophilus]|uniref:Small ribosomal subunit protein bS16 n=2 Tax=Geobacter TaxID=28231 RepID=RS16_GEOMG|nr:MULTISPECIES: 30S ribosomal protein S16 [Geobacter]Q39RN5.1 RecName: Full=Small ribosomal subunit protein bS16; AltName: Full=30S ribosomal protein S16 [Geobacter metallireducens GS-15]ABB33089.1 ribosomal protein S16 [Geobacter metallireducens GS-15]EHP84166.1 ribosomal protein S16 [Geobacter metallireducens RCH3]MBT0894796.1 30S ribosomal protein S16 [Geobacter hydrogenophilus]MBT1075053.1 30S ribosomal protein S16 [Geobacter grbiciae]GLI37366.1 30S ribosomal protein S16 [Geobacter hydro
MAIKMRLARAGAKKKPFYQIVIADVRSRRDGRFIENVGTYDPNQNPAAVKFEEGKALEWLGKGAQPTDTVKQMLKTAGLWEKFTTKPA